MPAWTVTVDRNRCLGSGICVLYAPDTFTHDDEAKAVVHDHGDALDAVRTAVEGCPTQALRLTTHAPTTNGHTAGGSAIARSSTTRPSTEEEGR
ncbi:ferredoxin [Streptomyces sp. PSKA54]|uniref:Ferredoxin n=1 Tax=Streptomyces himalayensis subsp. aureolus TaxID=2758039 RepID=A0A7W2HGE5_9ACTN|nr:ferredoxin [Streptomyces himalayensis]MBA4862831.1 ferredoxin [Streptomyces himalayensis subsp. aureolus]